ncbi:hypothetical protein V8C86DRAFT_2904992 [Haematococcus lacustris]
MCCRVKGGVIGRLVLGGGSWPWLAAQPCTGILGPTPLHARLGGQHGGVGICIPAAAVPHGVPWVRQPPLLTLPAPPLTPVILCQHAIAAVGRGGEALSRQA